MSLMVTELYDALRKAGVDEPLARDAARAVLGYDARTDLATKADIAELKLATKADIAELKLATTADIAELRRATTADIAELRRATKADLAELRLANKADLAELKAELLKWNVGAILAMTAIFAAIASWLTRPVA